MSAENALADLGLDLGTEAAAPAETPVDTAPVSETDTSEDKRTFTTVKISEDDIDIDTEGSLLPPTERKGFGGGARGSKYPFEKLPAPTGEGDARRYASFTVKVPEGEDYERVRRSVQSAATAANKSAKDDKTPHYYVTRQFNNEAGEAVGIRVFRTDERPADAEAK